MEAVPLISVTTPVSYLLQLFLEESMCITVGKRSNELYEAGFYYYVGSAKRAPAARINRHLQGGKKSTGILTIYANTPGLYL